MPTESLHDSSKSSASKKLVVVGSINMDLVLRCARLPTAGETILANQSTEVPGGKGANQAVAAARLGVPVAMIGRVGTDSFSDRLCRNLELEAIDISGVMPTPNSASGLAVIAVDAAGQNTIMVVPNANADLTPKDVDACIGLFQDANVVLLQLETPLATVMHTVRRAKSMGVKMVLDPAPAVHSLPPDLFCVDVMCPNQTEAQLLLGMPAESTDEAMMAALELVNRGTRIGIVTMGDRGAVVATDQGAKWYPPIAIQAVDATAAGDAFAAAFAVRWCETDSVDEAMRFANAAGAFSASHLGAQPSLPRRSDVHALLRQSAC